MTPNKTLIFKKVPEGFPVPGQDIVIEDRPIDLTTPPPENGVLAQVLVVSFDPYQRMRLREASIKSYSQPYDMNGPLTNAAVVRVVASANPRFAKGDLIRVPVCDMAEYAVVPGWVLERGDAVKLDPSNPIDPAHYLGVLGMPGLTAYAGLYEIGRPKRGETIFVSSAAGAVGALVGQLAKKEGLRVIGSAGSDAKVEYVKELGFDGAFNYKKEKPGPALDRLTPDGLDIYFENVGGEHLEAALERMNRFGRIPVCGMIDHYNKTPGEGSSGIIKNPTVIITKELTLRGFLVSSLARQYVKDHREAITKGLLDGSIKGGLSVTEGIDNAATGFVGMLKGENLGKAVLRISE